MRKAVWFIGLSLPTAMPRAAGAAFAGCHPANWGNQAVCTGSDSPEMGWR